MSTFSQKYYQSSDRKNVQSTPQSKFLSLSASDKDYLQITRSIPTSNPIKETSPDFMIKSEKIESTDNPFETLVFKGNNLNILQKSIEVSPNIQKLSRNQSDERLKKTLNQSENLSASRNSTRQTEAKLIVKRFAEERVKAEKEAEGWMKKYEELLLKIHAYEKNTKENKQNQINPQVIQELIAEIKAWENKSIETSQIIKNLRMDYDNSRKKNEGMEFIIKDITQKCEILEKKYKELEREFSFKVIKYEENINILNENIQKYNKEILLLKDFSLKQENELNASQNQLLQKELDLAKEKNKKSGIPLPSNISPNDNFCIRIVLLSTIIENLENQIKIWEGRCLSIEAEWSEKYRDLENSLRKSGTLEMESQRSKSNQKEEIEALMKKNDLYTQNLNLLEGKLHDKEINLTNMVENLKRALESENKWRYENEELKLNQKKLLNEAENKALKESYLLKEIELLKKILNQFDKSKEEEIASLNSFKETIRKSQNDKEINELHLRYRLEKEEFLNEINSLKTKLQLIMAEKDENFRIKLNSNLIINEKELLVDEKIQIIMQKDQEIHNLQLKLQNIESELHYKINSLSKELELYKNKPSIQVEGNIVIPLENEIRELKLRLEHNQSSQIETNTENYQIKRKLDEALNQIKDFSYEKTIEVQKIDQIHKGHREREKKAFHGQSEDLQNRIKSLEVENRGIREENEVLKADKLKFQINSIDFKEYEDILKFSMQLNQGKVEIESERMAYETAISQMKGRITDLEGVLAKTIKEFDESKRNLDLVIKEKDDYRIKSIKINNYIGGNTSNSNFLQRENDVLKNEIMELKNKFENERKAYETQIRYLKAMIENLKSDIGKCYTMLDERRKERDEAIKRNEESYKLSHSYITNDVRIDSNEILIKQTDDIKKERNYYKTLAEKNNINLSNTNQELITKIQELDDMKIKYQNSLLKLNSLESRLLDKLQIQELNIL